MEQIVISNTWEGRGEDPGREVESGGIEVTVKMTEELIARMMNMKGKRRGNEEKKKISHIITNVGNTQNKNKKVPSFNNRWNKSPNVGISAKEAENGGKEKRP